MTKPSYTYALLTRATTHELAAALPVRARVGTLQGWSVAALDPALITDAWPDETPDRTSVQLAHPVLAVYEGLGMAGVAVSRDGDTEPRMFTEGWLPPRGLLGRLFVRGWRSSAREFASRAGVPEFAEALAEVRQPAPDGTSIPVSEMLERAIAALGLPAEVRGVSLRRADVLHEPVDVDPVGTG